MLERALVIAIALLLAACRVKDGSLQPVTSLAPAPDARRWSEQRASAWYDEQPWRIGANYIPATAINQLEMWQASSFDLNRIDQELGWAERIGLNTVRVFLHDLAWQEDPQGFTKRVDAFLGVAERHHITPMLVIFDSCWDPFPVGGSQRAPRPKVHNSGWVQSPGAKALATESEHARLESYVRGVVRAFAADPRVLAWDVWNEPDSLNDFSYKHVEPKNKLDLVATLLPKVFDWARAEAPRQPLTSALWKGDWSTDAGMSPIERAQVRGSDVVSFHNYDGPEELEKRIKWLARFRRPILLTEYMARGSSTFQGTLPVAKKHKVLALSWGLVAGKTQTKYPWTSWAKEQPNEPAPWFHDLLRQDGTPYDPREVLFINAMMGR